MAGREATVGRGRGRCKRDLLLGSPRLLVGSFVRDFATIAIGVFRDAREIGANVNYLCNAKLSR